MAKLHLEATWTPRSIDPTPMSLASAGLLNPAFTQKISITVPNASNWVPLWGSNPEIIYALQHNNHLQSLTLKVQYFMHTSISHGTLHAVEIDLLWALTNGGFENLTEIIVQVQLQYEPGTEISQWDPAVISGGFAGRFHGWWRGERDGMCLTTYVNGWVLGGCLVCEHLVT
jgi:hypothetical protein